MPVRSESLRYSGLNERATKPRRGSLLPLCLRCTLTSVVALAVWIPCEVLGGLAFLALGIRLWTYHLAPVCWQLTSLLGWALLLPLLGGQCCLYLVGEQRAAVRGPWRWLCRALFLAVAGPVNEVVWNAVIREAFGRPLFRYTLLPTFGGSGSWLSPLYYLTLLSGFLLDERVPGTLGYRGPFTGPVIRSAKGGRS
jgi:hypothetical protein